jgi:MEMO1 family protein
MSNGPRNQSLLSEQSAGQAQRIRQPVMAGMFYPADPEQCRERAERYVLEEARGTDEAVGTVGSRWRGAVVPHAGWICSGAIAGLAIGAVRRALGVQPPDVVVVFGAIHSPWPAERAMFASADAWRTPLGDVRVCGELQGSLLNGFPTLFEVNDRFHESEHAVEVELPLVQVAWPDAMVLPVEVPPDERAADIGRAAAAEAKARGLSAVYLASSDLTHYGPAYGFAPAGVGPDGLAWAKANDRRLLDRVTALAADEIVPQALADRSACGPGAIAAMLAACLAAGATEGRLLVHRNSYETLKDVHPQSPTDAVGYAAVVVG